jgi:hypothetical protein
MTGILQKKLKIQSFDESKQGSMKETASGTSCSMRSSIKEIRWTILVTYLDVEVNLREGFHERLIEAMGGDMDMASSSLELCHVLTECMHGQH